MQPVVYQEQKNTAVISVQSPHAQNETDVKPPNKSYKNYAWEVINVHNFHSTRLLLYSTTVYFITPHTCTRG